MGCARNNNPFFEAYKNKYGAPPFEQIKPEHFMPSFTEGIKQHQTEIDAIADSKEVPTFENTIAAMDFSGELLNKVSSVFFNLYEAETNEALSKISNEVTPLLSEHNDNIYLNDKLFARVKILFNNRTKLGLSTEQNRLLEKFHRNFIRKGAALTPIQKCQLREINKELGLAELKFGQNVLEETNAYKKFIISPSDLAGLPESVRQAAEEEAKAAGKAGQWLFSTQKASFIPVLNYSKNRELRKELFMA
jgi:peptidyl-dipeptidase Dcp